MKRFEINTVNGSTDNLIEAALGGDVRQVSALLDAGATVDSEDSFGDTPLLLAAREGHTGVVEVLLDHGANVYARNSFGITPMMAAASRGNTYVVELLKQFTGQEVHTDSPPDENNHGASLLKAIQDGDHYRIDSLLISGVDVNAKTSDQWTALMIATVKGYTNVVQELLKRGADVNAKNNKGWTALRFAVSMDDIETMYALIGAGADVNTGDSEGKTALMQAAGENSLESLEILLQNGAEVNLTDRAGETALTIAARQGFTEAVAVLQQNGAHGATFYHSQISTMGERFHAGELLRLKKELDQFIPGADEAFLPVNQVSESEALVPFEHEDLVARLIAAITAFNSNGQTNKPGICVADAAHKVLLTLGEASALTNLSRGHLRKAIGQGKLKAQIIGRGWRIKRADLDEYVQRLF